MVEVSDTLTDYSQPQKWALGCSFVTGVVIFCAGVAADFCHWWPQWTFIPNGVTALSGFLTGVPTALVGLGWLEVQREQRKLQALSDGAWKEFSQRVKLFCNDKRIDALGVTSARIEDRWREIYAVITDYPPSQEGTAKTLASCDGWAKELGELLEVVAASIPEEQGLAIELAGVRSAWTFLDSYVRGRRIEMRLNNSWLQGTFDPHIRQKIEPEDNAIVRFIAQNSITRIGDVVPNYHWPASIRDLPAYLRHCGETQHMLLNSSAAPIYRINMRDYRDSAQAAATYMRELRDAVRGAETCADWPKPVITTMTLNEAYCGPQEIQQGG